MNNDKRVYSPPGNQVSGNDRLAEGGGSGQYARFVSQQCLGGTLLLFAQIPEKFQGERNPGEAPVEEFYLHLEGLKQVDYFAYASTGQAKTKPTSGRRSMVCEIRKAPIFRADEAETGSEKKIHIWPPLPDLDRSIGTLNAGQVSRKACVSSSHVALSKSDAGNRQVSSGSIGYTPTVKSRPDPS
jgi:hypothetical protein